MLGALVATSLRYGVQLGILWTVLTAGSLLSSTLRLPLPGNLTGMLLLLAALWSGVLPLEWVADVANLLVKHLMLFFIPLAVGLIVWQGLFEASGVVIVGSLIGSAVAGVLAAGLAAQFLAKSRK